MRGEFWEGRFAVWQVGRLAGWGTLGTEDGSEQKQKRARRRTGQKEEKSENREPGGDLILEEQAVGGRP